MVQIPLVPQWNLNSGCVCTPDGGFLYAGSRSINFIGSIDDENETPIIKCFHTRQGILSLDVDPYWGQKEVSNVDGDPNDTLGKSVAAVGKDNIAVNYFAALLQDSSVQIWDFNKGCAIQGHKAHLAYMRYMEGNGPSPKHSGEVFLSYMCNRNVLSIDSQDIVVYCVASNSFYRRPTFFSSKNHQMTSIKCSPYNENHLAIGTKRGLVLLCDLQKMTTLYTLRGHDCSVKSLAWNRIDLSEGIYGAECDKTKTGKHQTKQGKLIRSHATIDSDEIFDIYDYDYLENEFGAPSRDFNCKKESSSDFIGIEKPKESSTTAKFDFAEACQSLKEEINALRDEQSQTCPEHIISIDECRQAANRNHLSSCDSEDNVQTDARNGAALSDNDSSDGSLVRLSRRTPSSESVDVDGMHRNHQNFICQADVHQIDHQSIGNEQIKSNEALIGHSTDVKMQTANTTGKRWKENENDCFESKEAYDILLVSSSVDGTFCVWNATTGGTCDTHKVRSSHAGKNTQIEISWISSTSIIINNKHGELQLWSMNPLQNNEKTTRCGFRMYKFKEVKREWFQRSVVSLACYSKKHLLWTISSHREVCLEDIESKRILLHYSCVSTNIGAMQECPDDMNKIALGFSDRRIGIIDISRMTPTFVCIENFVQRVESNVMSLVWSPDCKRLAYGTAEGRIGIINLEAPNKQPHTYNSICGRPIYSISWHDKYLYVVCNEHIAVYEDDQSKKDPHVIPDIDSVACISLRENCLFVGTQSGQLKLYVRSTGSTYFQYEFKTSLELAPRYVSDISWSPIATNKLAVVANANSIHILEFNSDTADLQIKRKIEIDSPKAANGFVKWSNRSENSLLTCGFDGAVRVWDLSNDSNLERFVKIYHCPMKCGLFLPTDEEIIICSGKSAALELIDMRIEKSESNSGKTKRLIPRTLDTVQWATKAVTRNDAKLKTIDKKLNRLAKTPDNTIVEQLENKLTAPGKVESSFTDTEEVSTMLVNLALQKEEEPHNIGSIYMKNPLTLLYLTTKEINKDALEVMFSILSSPKSIENKSLSQKLFGTKAEAKELLALELKNQQRSEIKGISNLFMPQLSGHLKDEILKCVQSKQLCEWHVSLAPSISYSFWQKCCQAYAEQLIEQGHALQAAVYMLAIHQQQDAIEMLIEKKLFKEASLIARLYLQPEDPLNNSISAQWIVHLCGNGNLTGAALLCLLTKQNNRAYDCLAKIRTASPEIERVIRLIKSSDI